MTKNFTKAESLLYLKKYEKKINFKIPKFFFVTKKEYLSNKFNFFKKINKYFKNKNLILRSSSLQEDKSENSNAGKYKSFSNIYFKDEEKIIKNIDKIIKDFDNLNDQILVQEYIDRPRVSGVIFTRDIKNNSPYLRINYDTSGRTDLVTSGQVNPTMKTINIYKKNLKKFIFFNFNLSFLFKFEKIYKTSGLDIEFCIKGKNIFIFQCRPLKKTKKVNDIEVDETLINIEKKFKKLNKKIPSLHGSYTLFSNMSDWNPAEMIGTKPHPLASSLYSELITDYIWSKQRSDYGYKNVEPSRLMINLAGTTYIDVRTDFNSFLPKNLSSKVQKKAVNYYLNCLKKKSYNHDKIEFEVVETCYDFNLKEKFKMFLSKLETKEYIRSLKDLTNKVLDKQNDLLNKEMKKIEKLDRKIKEIRKNKLSEIQKIYFLVNDCKRFGTLPFAGLARIAFIYTKIIKSLVDRKILSNQDYETFYEACSTITNEMNNDLFKLKKNNKIKKSFLQKYGHLRPSTYSIISKNYKENFSNYFNNVKSSKPRMKKFFNLKENQKKKINRLFHSHGLKITSKDFFSQAKKSIEMREYSKFIFSKSINEIFENLISLGKEVNISRKDLEYLSIKNLINFYNNLNTKKLKRMLNEEIQTNKNEEKVLNLLKMPDFLSSINDLYIQKDKTRVANYITDNIITGNLVEINKIKNFNKLDNKIVLLKNADPGYDFIFSRKLKGLITCYGGANSHMSIRCLELDIPAIIGVGSKTYNEILNSNSIEINCKQNYFQKIT